MERPHRVERQLSQRFLGAKRHVRVRMRAVDHLHERAVGNRRRHVANLHEPRQPELSNAIEVSRLEPWPNHTVGKQRQRWPRELRERGHAEHRCVRGHVGIEVRAKPGKGSIHVDGRQISGPFVHQVGRYRGEPLEPFKIGGRSGRQCKYECHDGKGAVVGRPERQPIRKFAFVDTRKSKWRGRSHVGQT